MKERYSNYLFEKLNFLSKLKRPNLRLTIIGKSPLSGDACKDLNSCLGKDCQMTLEFVYDNDHGTCTYQKNFVIVNPKRFKKNIDKFRKQHSKYHVIVTKIDKTNKKQLLDRVLTIVLSGLASVIIAYVFSFW